MQQISFFLEKFKVLGRNSALAKNVFTETIKKILDTDIPLTAVEVRNGTVYVKAHPALKSEIFLKRELILSELAKILGPVKIKSLR